MPSISRLVELLAGQLSGYLETLAAAAAGALEFWILAGAVAGASALLAYGGWLMTIPAGPDRQGPPHGLRRLSAWTMRFSPRREEQYDQLDGLLAELLAASEPKAGSSQQQRVEVEDWAR